MPDIKFSCPHCQQHIQAETGYAGLQITCPACHGSLTVPGSPAPPPPPPPMAMRPAASATPAAPPSTAASGCPSCGGALPRGAVLCTSCGYNLKTGQRTVAGRPAAAGKPSPQRWETPWYKTAYPYIGGVIVLLAVLYFFGRTNPPIMLAFVGLALLYSVGVHIIVVVAAFKESAGTGFLTLCVPFYALYFVFKVAENDTLKLLYTSAVIINLSLRFLGAAVE